MKYRTEIGEMYPKCIQNTTAVPSIRYLMIIEGPPQVPKKSFVFFFNKVFFLKMHFCFVRASESIRVQKYFNFLSQILHRMQNPTFVVKCVSHQIFAFFTTREEVKAVGLTREDTEVVTTAAAEITTHNNNNICHNN